MKILSIGNSFSQDAHNLLHTIAEQNGKDIQTVNLCIGGCSLKTHHHNLVNNLENHFLERNGGEGERRIGIREALKMDDFDVVTLQQVSELGGIFDSFFPYVTVLTEEIRAAQPNAKLYLHQTWGYEIDSGHPGFDNYDRDQKKMFLSIKETCLKVADLINAAIIPTGDTIQYLRENVKEFDYKNGGLSLCRDSFHLSLDYGRYAAAVTWYYTLTGEKPKVYPLNDMSPQLMQKIVDSL